MEETVEGNPAKRTRTLLDVFQAWVRENAEAFVGQAEVTTGCQDFPKAEEFGRAHEVEAEMVVTQFYDGAIADSNPLEYSPDPQFCKTKESPTGWNIGLKNLFQKKDGKTPSKITLTGPAGIGKTTALKRFVRNNPNKFIFVLCGSNFDGNGDTKLSLFDFLFPNREGISEDALNVGFEWMKANHQEITFVLDSLDTLPFKVSAEELVSDTEGRYSAASFLSSIMARRMLTDCKMVSSSREHGIAGYQKEIRADRIISLVGLTKESIQKHVNFVLKHDDAETKSFCEVVERRHPGLWALCATPLFLVFTLIGYKKGKHIEDSFPSTMSGIMVKLLQDLFLSSHGKRRTRQKAKKVQGIMDNLKMLSYYGILKSKVTFSEDDLTNAALEPEEATALSIFVPFCETRKLPQWNVIRGRRLLFFCHQCVQEILAAMFVIQMKVEDFKKFVEEELKKPKLSVVRRFLSGLLLNEQVFTAAVHSKLLKDPSDVEEKRKILQQHLQGRLTQSKNNKPERLELYISLHEAGEGVKDVIRSAMKYINLHGLQRRCTISDVHAIGSIMKYCDRLHEFNLSDCELTAAKVQSLDAGIDIDGIEKRILIEKFVLKFNWDMGVGGITALGNILKKFSVLTLILDGCRLTSEQLKHLAQQFQVFNVKLRKLQLEEQEGIEVSEEMVAAVCSILPSITKRLDLRGWNFTTQGRKSIEDALKATKRLDDSYSTGVVCGEDGEDTIEPERLEDVFEDLCKRFSIAGMRYFARRRDGLDLTMECQRDVQDSFKGSKDVNDEKMTYLRKWKEIHGRKATASALRQIAEDHKPSGS